MAYIGRGTESISNVEVLDNLTFDGSASYTLQKSSTNFVPSSANNLLISISGVVQQGNFSVSGSTITFDTVVSGSDTCDWILHYGIGLITTVADGTVTTAKLAGGLTVTHAVGSAGSPSITFDSDSNTGIFSPSADTIAFTEGGTEAMRINSSGNVGIGTSSPAQILQATDADGTGFVGIRTQNNNANLGLAGIEFSSDPTYSKAAIAQLRLNVNGNGPLLFFVDSATDAANWSTGDEKMRITSDGKVGIGTTSPSAKLEVNGDVLIPEATLTDGATISWDVSTSPVAKVTLGGNRTISAPSNSAGAGQFVSLLVIQDGTGSRTLTWNAVYEFASDTAPTLTTTGGKGDLFVFRYNGTKWLEVGRNLNLSLS